MSRQWQPAAVRVGIFENFSENENENENENRVTENRKKPNIFSVTGESIFSYISGIKFLLLLKFLIILDSMNTYFAVMDLWTPQNSQISFQKEHFRKCVTAGANLGYRSDKVTKSASD